MDKIVLKGLPLPPSVNESLISRGCFKDGRIKTWISSSLIADQFKYSMNDWKNKNILLVNEIKPIVKKMRIIKIDLYCGFHWKRLFTLKCEPKMLDSHNRNKQMFDRIAEILSHDDKYFFSGDCEKVTVPDSEKESATVVLTASTSRTMADVLRELEDCSAING